MSKFDQRNPAHKAGLGANLGAPPTVTSNFGVAGVMGIASAVGASSALVLGATGTPTYLSGTPLILNGVQQAPGNVAAEFYSSQVTAATAFSTTPLTSGIIFGATPSNGAVTSTGVTLANSTITGNNTAFTVANIGLYTVSWRVSNSAAFTAGTAAGYGALGIVVLSGNISTVVPVSPTVGTLIASTIAGGADVVVGTCMIDVNVAGSTFALVNAGTSSFTPVVTIGGATTVHNIVIRPAYFHT